MDKKFASRRKEQRVTLKDISKASGICLSSVSKALSGHAGVSKETREIVMETARSMGYRVNRLAQSLSRNDILIGIIVPTIWPEYYEPLEQGIEAELHELRDFRISALYHRVPNFYSTSDIVEALHQLVDAHVNAIILCPNFVYDCTDELDKLAEMRIPVVLLGTNLRGAKRFTCVRQNAYLAGQLASEFMGHLLAPGKTAAAFIGNKNMEDHLDKARGFRSWPGVNANSNVLADVYETLDEPDIAYAITHKLLRERSDIGGIYVATSNSVAVCECIRDNGMGGAIKVIGTDAFASMEPLFAEGLLEGILFQDPIQQGKLAVRVLFDYLTIGKKSPSEILINPQLVLSSNFSYYLNYTQMTPLEG